MKHACFPPAIYLSLFDTEWESFLPEIFVCNQKNNSNNVLLGHLALIKEHPTHPILQGRLSLRAFPHRGGTQTHGSSQ